MWRLTRLYDQLLGGSDSIKAMLPGIQGSKGKRDVWNCRNYFDRRGLKQATSRGCPQRFSIVGPDGYGYMLYS